MSSCRYSFHIQFKRFWIYSRQKKKKKITDVIKGNTKKQNAINKVLGFFFFVMSEWYSKLITFSFNFYSPLFLDTDQTDDYFLCFFLLWINKILLTNNAKIVLLKEICCFLLLQLNKTLKQIVHRFTTTTKKKKVKKSRKTKV